MIGMAALQVMKEEAKRAIGRPDDAWIGQYHLGAEMALELIELARCEVMRRAQIHRDGVVSARQPRPSVEERRALQLDRKTR